MAHKTLAIVAVLSLVGLVFLAYLAMTFESPQQTRTVEIEQPVPRPAEPVRQVPESSEDEEQDAAEAEREEPGPLPLPDALVAAGQEPEEPVEPLPDLNDSDERVLGRLAEMELGARLLRLITPEEVIRRFVVFTDNVARESLPQMEYPVRRLEQDMAVEEVDDNLYVMQEASHERFDTLVDTLVSLDVDQAMAVYESLRPLFIEAYAELGYGEQDFDAVVADAIDQVLAAEVPEGPYQLIRPSVMYEFADSSLEELSPLEKQLIRIGPENTARLKQRLQDYRDELAN
ncbi:MAG: DUF3014 domain-containing protein [Pseudohongiellaceae bacterium]